MFPGDGTSPRNWVGCWTSRVYTGCPTTARATPLVANLPANAATVKMLTPHPTPQDTLILQLPTHTPTPR